MEIDVEVGFIYNKGYISSPSVAVNDETDEKTGKTLINMTIMSRSFKSFDDLKAFLKESGQELELLVYPTLKFGAVYWIPDEDSELGGDGAHPWIVISDYRPGMSVVTACLRTSSNIRQSEKGGLYQPAGVLPGLNREGVVLPGVRKPFEAQKFRDYRYEGQLPEEWVTKLKSCLG